jgi:hypothetical protein
MNLNLLQFTTKFFLNNDPIDFSLTDDTVYSATEVNTAELVQPEILTSQVEGIVTAYLPSGTIFYAGSFSAADIDRNVSDTASGLEITLDAYDEVSKGTYQFDYTVRVTDEIFKFPILVAELNASSGKDRIKVKGDWRDVNDDATRYDIVGNDTAGNNKEYTVNVISYDSTNNYTVFEVDETMTDYDISGYFQITATRDYVASHEHDYQYVEPEASITMSYDLNKSQLSSTDNTDYGDYLSVTRTHTVKYPVDTPSPIADVVQPLKTILINPIYTNNFTTTLSTVLEATTDDGLLIQATIEGTENIDVNADDTLNNCYLCIQNVYSNYYTSLISRNQTGINKWGELSQKIGNEFDLYQIARSSGLNAAAQVHLTAIKALLNGTGCTPTTNTNSRSVLVIAVSAGGVSTNYNEVVNAWYSGSADPLAGQYSDTDWYLNTATGEAFQKVSGAWVSKVASIFGTDGDDGTIIHAGSGTPGAGLGVDGDFYIDDATAYIWKKAAGAWSVYVDPNGENGIALLHRNTALRTFSTAGTNLLTGLQYTVAANQFVANDEIWVECVIKRDDSQIADGSIAIEFGGIPVAKIDWTAGVDIASFLIKLQLISVTSFMSRIERYAGFSNLAGPPASKVQNGTLIPGRIEITGSDMPAPGFDFSAGFNINVMAEIATANIYYGTQFNIYKVTRSS